MAGRGGQEGLHRGPPAQCQRRSVCGHPHDRADLLFGARLSDIALVVSDLDGTLWHTDDRVHPDTVAALAELDRRGIPLLIATGRRVTSTRRPLAALGLAPPAVVLNGAIGLELHNNQRFWSHPFEPGEAAATLGAFREVGIDPVVYVDTPEVSGAAGAAGTAGGSEGSVFVSERPGTSEAHLAGLAADCRVGDLEAVVRDYPVLSFSLIGVDFAPCREVEKRLDGLATPKLDRSIDFGGAALIVGPLGLSKWAGVEAWCRRAGLSPDAVLAIGDGPNDVEMLGRAAVAVSLEGSHPDALAAADHVVPPALEGGWSRLLDLV